jgi:hypothetical protein
MAPFWPFLYKIGQISAANLSGLSTFYSATFFIYAAEQSAGCQHCSNIESFCPSVWYRLYQKPLAGRHDLYRDCGIG